MSNQLDPFVSPRQVIRARDVLPALGAWDAAPVEINASGANFVLLFLDYLAGAAAGAVDVQLEAAPNSVDGGAAEPDWYPITLFAPGAMAAGTDITSLVQREFINYTSVAVIPEVETYCIGPIELRSCVERLRLRARETGNVGAPGTLGVWAALG